MHSAWSLMNRRTRACVTCALMASLLSQGCSTARPVADVNRARIDNPPEAVTAQVESWLPAAEDFVNSSERAIAVQGRALTESERKLAAAVGVAHPEAVRVLVTESFLTPVPGTPFSEEARKLGVGSRAEGGLTLGYGIELKTRYAGKPWILAHELTHVAQFERLGHHEFLRQYLAAALIFGADKIPLESDASKNEMLARSL